MARRRSWIDRDRPDPDAAPPRVRWPSGETAEGPAARAVRVLADERLRSPEYVGKVTIVSVRYRFRQLLGVPARAAFDWCTDFRAEDAALFGDRRRRTLRWVAPDALVMTDTTYPAGRPVRIRRLVRLQPEAMAWTNTHLDGPYRHSQFWYRIVSDGPRRCHLDFSGLMLVNRIRRLSEAERAKLARSYRRSDATVWRQRLGPALEAELRADRDSRQHR